MVYATNIRILFKECGSRVGLVACIGVIFIFSLSQVYCTNISISAYNPNKYCLQINIYIILMYFYILIIIYIVK